jgi:hypothetical protein
VIHPSDHDERAQSARLDRQVERRLATQPRFTITRAIVGSESVVDAVWDHQTNRFTPVGAIVAALFAAVGVA